MIKQAKNDPPAGDCAAAALEIEKPNKHFRPGSNDLRPMKSWLNLCSLLSLLLQSKGYRERDDDQLEGERRLLQNTFETTTIHSLKSRIGFLISAFRRRLILTKCLKTTQSSFVSFWKGKKSKKNCRPCRHKNNNLRKNLQQKLGENSKKKKMGGKMGKIQFQF